MNAEQRRRVRRQKQTSQKALKIFKPLNRELEQVITRNEVGKTFTDLIK